MEKNTLTPLEEQLFDWEGWGDGGDPGSLEFVGVTLKVPMGDYEVGTKFAGAFWSSASSTLLLRSEEGDISAFRLKVSVGEKLEPEDLMADDACGDDCSCHGHNPDPTATN